MDIRLRASPEQFAAMLDFMEKCGPIGKPKQKKASQVNRDTHGTGGGPRRGKPLNPHEERVLNIIGVTSVTGREELQEVGFELPIETNPRSSSQDYIPLPPSDPEPEPIPEANVTVEIPMTPEPDSHPPPRTANRRLEDAMRSPSAGPSTPRRRRLIGLRRRRHQTPFEQTAAEFVRIEESRLKLEETRIIKQHEKEMEQLRVESQRIAMEENRNKVFQKITDIGNNMMIFLSQSQQK